MQERDGVRSRAKSRTNSHVLRVRDSQVLPERDQLAPRLVNVIGEIAPLGIVDHDDIAATREQALT